MAITFDAATFGGGYGVASPCTFSHTVSGSQTYLVVMTATRPNNEAAGVSGVTYAGAAMTLLAASESVWYELKLWGKLAPASGANNVVVTYAPSTYGNYFVASSWNGVDQTTPTRTAATAGGGGASASSVTATTVAGDREVDGLVVEAAPSGITVGASQTDRGSGGTWPGFGCSDEIAAGVSTAMTWTWTGAATWYAAAVPLVPALPAGGQSVIWWP